MKRFLIITHRWFVNSKEFKHHVVELTDKQFLPICRKLTWRERLLGRYEGPVREYTLQELVE